MKNITFNMGGLSENLLKALIIIISLSAFSLHTMAQPGRRANGNNSNSSNCLPVVGASFSSDGLSSTTTSTKELSNVVLLYCDGVHQKFDNLSGFVATFSGTGANDGKKIVGAWIKSGCNQSGDGPGYGTFVANPDSDVCNSNFSCYAFDVVSYNPGMRYDFSPVAELRANPDKALGEPQKSDATTTDANVNFVALGFGGELTIRFEYPIANGPGADVKIWETTFTPNTGNCLTYPETIDVFASQDGCNWSYIGGGCQDTELDLGALSWAQYIRIQDVSERAPFANVGHIADGYDVDGIECLNGAAQNPVIETSNCEFAVSVVEYNRGFRKDGQAILADRTNPDNATGAPQRNETINFVSLGFGGNLILDLNCVVFDKPGMDIEVVETSFGSPSCANYPETARIEGSLDFLSWETLGEICLDGFIDLAGKKPVRFLRITDLSNPASFSNSTTTDGFDVDGVVVLQPGCYSSGSARIASPEFIGNNSASSNTNVYPNPFTEQFNLRFTAGEQTEAVQVKVFNALGQVVLSESFVANSNSEINTIFNLETKNQGIYFVTVIRNGVSEAFRLVKQ
jgi:hypothetical protein